jgi:hypothetical protein
LANPREKTPEQTEIEQLRRKVYELEVAGELSRDWE